MPYQPKIKLMDGQNHIFCDWRQKWVKLTPEEWVRQHFLHYLTEEYNYPKSAIAVEYSITLGQLSKRCDAVVFDKMLNPVCIVEFKAEDVKLTQKAFDQIAVYNINLNVNYLIISNGQQTYSCRVDDNKIEFLNLIPTYQQLQNGKNN